MRSVADAKEARPIPPLIRKAGAMTMMARLTAVGPEIDRFRIKSNMCRNLG